MSLALAGFRFFSKEPVWPLVLGVTVKVARRVLIGPLRPGAIAVVGILLGLVLPSGLLAVGHPVQLVIELLHMLALVTDDVLKGVGGSLVALLTGVLRELGVLPDGRDFVALGLEQIALCGTVLTGVEVVRQPGPAGLDRPVVLDRAGTGLCPVTGRLVVLVALGTQRRIHFAPLLLGSFLGMVDRLGFSY